MQNRKTVTIAVPVFNEETMINEIYSRLCAVMNSIEKQLTVSSHCFIHMQKPTLP